MKMLKIWKSEIINQGQCKGTRAKEIVFDASEGDWERWLEKID
jgi:hypothetical protein